MSTFFSTSPQVKAKEKVAKASQNTSNWEKIRYTLASLVVGVLNADCLSYRRGMHCMWRECEGVAWYLSALYYYLFPLACISRNSILIPRSSPPSTVAFKVLRNPVFLRSTNREIHVDRLYVFLICYLGIFNRSLSVYLGIFPVSCRHWHPIIRL